MTGTRGHLVGTNDHVKLINMANVTLNYQLACMLMNWELEAIARRSYLFDLQAIHLRLGANEADVKSTS